ncbi:hypothetical protein [Billgrantia antri]|nr:hypothetical protein [Halomonas sulfidivorans]
MNRVFRPLGLRLGLLPRQPALLERALALSDNGASGNRSSNPSG